MKLPFGPRPDWAARKRSFASRSIMDSSLELGIERFGIWGFRSFRIFWGLGVEVLKVGLGL